MTALARDLLEQAHHLANREPRRPRQASRRRAVSSAYYALFHLLVDEATRLISEPALRGSIGRTLAHEEMKQACVAFAAGGLPSQVQSLGVTAVSRELRFVAQTFKDLQQQRHEADYNTDRIFVRHEVLNFVQSVEQAFQEWQTIRSTLEARVYLASLMFWKRWR